MISEITGNFQIGDFDFEEDNEPSIDVPAVSLGLREIGTQDALKTGFDGEISPRRPSNLLLLDHGDYYGEYMLGEPMINSGCSLFDGTFSGKMSNDMNLGINSKSCASGSTAPSRPYDASFDPSLSFSVAAELNASLARAKEHDLIIESQSEAKLLENTDQVEEEGSTRNSSIPMNTRPLSALRKNVKMQMDEQKAAKAIALSRTDSNSSETSSRAKPTHPFRGRQQMQHEEFQSWSVKKIQMLAAEMEAIEDKSSARYKKLAKQKRSQEDRLRIKNKDKTMERKLDMMDQVLAMLVKEAKSSLKTSKAQAFEKELARLTKAN